MIRLSICICSLHERQESLLSLIASLQRQDRISEVEILVFIDDGQVPMGTKQNRLINAAVGDFVVFIDDDDAVDANYVSKILVAIDQKPQTDVVLIRGRRTCTGSSPITFDYQLSAGTVNGDVDVYGVLWRSPGHLCPIRTTIAKKVPFLDVWNGHDLVWVDQLKAHLRTAIRAGGPNDVLYHYLYDAVRDRCAEGDEGTKPLKLSICISGLTHRQESLFQLLRAFRRQARHRETEILLVLDAGVVPTGSKRNRLIRASLSEFVAHVDDDDMVSNQYLHHILAAIERDPTADVITLRGVRTTSDGKTPVAFDFRIGAGTYEPTVEDDVLWRSPGHLCPVRRDLAKMVKYPDIVHGEDIELVERIRPLLQREVHAGGPEDVLYYYQFDSSKPILTPPTGRKGKTIRIAGKEIFLPDEENK